MNSAQSFPADALAPLAGTDPQRLAARMAQDAFAEIFRLAFTPDPAQHGKILADVEARCLNWCQAGDGETGRALRTALLTSALDQWGLAYTQTFKLTAIAPLSALIGALRSRLEPRADALFQGYFRQIETVESDAVDFKIELRRNIHLALWHAMAACPTRPEAEEILQPLGSMLLALDRQLPELGWRLVADTLAHIQVALLSDSQPVSAAAREYTQQLFDALRHALPVEHYRTIMHYAGQVIAAWQQARRSSPVH